ncbi:MAG: nickel pincer cofactor biosynthesis protein LarB [Candidatus Omnitrophota bacterium]|nr:nickel pincer cofactor biosynthesis protein LarB [Candidatus Omnitrophota bacterium]
MSQKLKSLLKRVKSGEMSSARALGVLKDLPYKDLGFAKVDCHRRLRRGFPEVIFGSGKTPEQIVKIAGNIISHDGTLLITRTDKKVFSRIKKICPGAKFDEKAKIIYFVKEKSSFKKGTVLVVTAGTGDLPVAQEARITLEVMGNKVQMLYDVGVAGVHRLLDSKDTLEKANVIIVIAGMEGALASVVSGLVSRPVIAVPTSVGYGASFSGLAPLLTMMNSCSPGVAVVNIDNGFGAGYMASMINS